MLKKILIVIVALLAAFLAVAAMQPDTFTVTRTATVAAAPETVFALVNDFHEWPKWSPWEQLDPNMTRTHTGSPAGQGASYAWTGNSDVGSGRMTIAESRPNEHVRIDLEFIEPFASKSITDFSFQPEGAGTKVEWKMSGDNNFISKIFGLLMGGMDKMVGPDFEKGLAQMKSAAESM
ncbi:MAG: SRPBCC family protein [Bryobacteraceae bacterium]